MPDETPPQDRSAAPGEEAADSSSEAPWGGGRVPAPAPPADDLPERAEAGGTGAESIGETGGTGKGGEGGGAGDDSPTGHLGGGGRPGDIVGPPEDEPAPVPSGSPVPAGAAPAGPPASGKEGGDGGDTPVPAAVRESAAVGTPTAGGRSVPDPAHDIEQRKREAGADQRFPFGRPGLPLGRAHPFVFGFTAALGVITAWLLVQAATNAKSVLVMIVVAMFLAVGLNPAVERLKRLGLSRGWAVGVVFFCVLLFFAGFVASLVPPLTEQVTELTKSLPDYIQQLRGNRRIAEWDQRYHLLQQAQDKINDSKFQQKLATEALNLGKVALIGTFQGVTILILTLYFLGSLPQIKAFAYQLAPRTRRARVALLGDEILGRIGGYVAGQFTIAFIAGLTSYVFLEILGVPYALALALIVAVTDLVPLVGATVGAVIVCLVAFLTGTFEGIAAVIFYVIYQQVENYLVYPRVMKRTVDVQPAVTVVAALVGGTLLGVPGALLAIPTAAAISLLIREVVIPRQETL